MRVITADTVRYSYCNQTAYKDIITNLICHSIKPFPMNIMRKMGNLQSNFVFRLIIIVHYMEVCKIEWLN